MTQWKLNAYAGLTVLSGALLPIAAAAQAPPSHIAGRVLVKFKRGATKEQVQGALASAKGADAGALYHSDVHVIKLSKGVDESAAAKALSKRSEVEFAELDAIRKAEATPNDPQFASQWHLPKIAAPTAWDTSSGSAGVTIAILDTGCDPTHPDLASNYVAGWNFYDNNSDTHDVYGHGTATAGTAAAAGNNGVGVSGVAWHCKIMPLRISDTAGYAFYSTAASALTWAADHGARVANISYQMSESSTVASAAQYFQSKGGVVAISAGNSSLNNTVADDPYVLTVSATDSTDALASFSNYGNNIDLAAPGVNILTTTNGGGWGWWSGTSFSAPIVAGTAALVLSTNPGLTGAQAQQILTQSADDLGTGGWDNRYGWGRVNASKAVALAKSAPAGDTIAPSVAFSAPSGGASVTGTASIQVSASDNVGVTSVSVYVDNVLIATKPAAPFTFSWNTSSVLNGAHTLKAVAADAANNSATATISVNVTNTSDTSPPSVSIVTPAASITVSGNLSVTASATDNVAVVKVEMYVDGKLTSTKTGAPWTFTVNTRKWPAGSHSLQCKAYDAAGNTGVSQLVTVNK